MQNAGGGGSGVIPDITNIIYKATDGSQKAITVTFEGNKKKYFDNVYISDNDGNLVPLFTYASNLGRNSVDSLKVVDGEKQIFYETTENTTDYTKIWIRLENDEAISNIELPKVGNKTLYDYAYEQGVTSIKHITSYRKTLVQDTAWDEENKTVTAEFYLYAKDENNETLFSDVGSFTIYAQKAYKAGADNVNFDNVTPTVYIGESDYQPLINGDNNVGYGTINGIGYVYGTVNVKLTNNVTKTLYVGIEATKASNAPVSNVRSITKKYWRNDDAENITSNSSNYYAFLNAPAYVYYYTDGTNKRLRGLININLSDNTSIPAYIEMDATNAYNAGATSTTINITSGDVSPNGAVSSSTARVWHYYPEYENFIPAEPEIEGQTGYSEYKTTYNLPVKATFYANGTFKSFTDNLNITPYVGSGSSGSVALTTLTLTSADDNNKTHRPPNGYSGFSSVTVEIPTGSSSSSTWTASVESKDYSLTPLTTVNFGSGDIEYYSSDKQLHGFLRVRRGNKESKVIKLNIDTSHVPTSGESGSGSTSINWSAFTEDKNYSGTPLTTVDFGSDDIEYWNSDSKLHGFLRVRRGNSESKVIKLSIDTSHVPGGSSHNPDIAYEATGQYQMVSSTVTFREYKIWAECEGVSGRYYYAWMREVDDE